LVNTQDRPYPSEIIVLIQNTDTVHTSVIDIERSFSTYFIQYVDMVLYRVTVPTLEFGYLLIITLIQPFEAARIQ